MKTQFLKFIIVGGLCAGVDLSVLYFLILIGFSDLLSITLGFIAGLLVNYYMHARFTFEVQKLYISSGVKFIIVVGINYAITIFSIFLLTSTLAFTVILAKVVSLPVIAINGYLLSKYWVFSNLDKE